MEPVDIRRRITRACGTRPEPGQEMSRKPNETISAKTPDKAQHPKVGEDVQEVKRQPPQTLRTPQPPLPPMGSQATLILKIPRFFVNDSNVPFSKSMLPGSAPSPSDPIPESIFHLDIGANEGWLNNPDLRPDAFVKELMRDCINRFENTEWKPYSASRLSSFKILPESVVAPVHVVRCASPSDFNIIILDKNSSYSFGLINSKWLRFPFKRESRRLTKSGVEWDEDGLKSRINRYCFQNPAELYTGLQTLLWSFMQFVEKEAGEEKRKKLGQMELKSGHMVVVAKPGEEGKAYRGVLLEPVEVHMGGEFAPLEDCFKIYVMDTGETRVVYRPQMLPLPRAFIEFKPLAIPCKLAGINQNDREWTSAVVQRFQHLVNPGGPFKTKLHVEFKSMEALKITDGKLRAGSNEEKWKEPFSVHLFGKEKSGNDVSIAQLLAEEGHVLLTDPEQKKDQGPPKFETEASKGTETPEVKKEEPRQVPLYENAAEDLNYEEKKVGKYQGPAPPISEAPEVEAIPEMKKEEPLGKPEYANKEAMRFLDELIIGEDEGPAKSKSCISDSPGTPEMKNESRKVKEYPNIEAMRFLDQLCIGDEDNSQDQGPVGRIFNSSKNREHKYQ